MTVHFKNRTHSHLTSLVDGDIHQNCTGFPIKNIFFLSPTIFRAPDYRPIVINVILAYTSMPKLTL